MAGDKPHSNRVPCVLCSLSSDRILSCSTHQTCNVDRSVYHPASASTRTIHAPCPHRKTPWRAWTHSVHLHLLARSCPPLLRFVCVCQVYNPGGMRDYILERGRLFWPD